MSHSYLEADQEGSTTRSCYKRVTLHSVRVRGSMILLLTIYSLAVSDYGVSLIVLGHVYFTLFLRLSGRGLLFKSNSIVIVGCSTLQRQIFHRSRALFLPRLFVAVLGRAGCVSYSKENGTAL